MLIMINFTGLEKVYWLPNIRHNSDKEGLWFIDLRFINFQIGCYSKEMGIAMIRKLKEQK